MQLLYEWIYLTIANPMQRVLQLKIIEFSYLLLPGKDRRSTCDNIIIQISMYHTKAFSDTISEYS